MSAIARNNKPEKKNAGIFSFPVLSPVKDWTNGAKNVR